MIVPIILAGLPNTILGNLASTNARFRGMDNHALSYPSSVMGLACSIRIFSLLSSFCLRSNAEDLAPPSLALTWLVDEDEDEEGEEEEDLDRGRDEDEARAASEAMCS